MNRIRTALFTLLAMSLTACSTAAPTSTPVPTVEPTAQPTVETTLTRVGISWAMDEESAMEDEDIQAYVEAIIASGGEPVLMKQAVDEESAKAALAEVDCVVMAGGEDINPSMYGEEAHEYLEDVNDERDLSDSLVLKEAISMDMPVLATCRGMQMLNVVCGGTLYQDLPTEYVNYEIDHRDPELEDFTYHNITVEEGSLLAAGMKDGAGTYEVNSWHHQGVKTVGEGLKVTAMAEDGMIEALELEGHKFIFGVQFHPEWHIVEDTLDCTSLFQALMNASK